MTPAVRQTLAAGAAGVAVTLGAAWSAALVTRTPALAESAPPVAHRVTLADASSPPTRLLYLRPGRTRCIAPRLAYGMSDVQAYRWNGRALPAQRYSRDGLTILWGRVAFDGVCWQNGTRQPILAAVWA